MQRQLDPVRSGECKEATELLEIDSCAGYSDVKSYFTPHTNRCSYSSVTRTSANRRIPYMLSRVFISISYCRSAQIQLPGDIDLIHIRNDQGRRFQSVPDAKDLPAAGL